MSVSSPDNPLDFPGPWDALVIGGGFYGCSIATTLKSDYDLNNVLVVERETDLLKRASYRNQARVHNGYHYPRSFTTAFRSRVNFLRFAERYRDCIADDFTMLYCIGARNSYITKYQFENFCAEIGADLRPVDAALQNFFNPALIDAVYEVTEYAFNATKLAAVMRQEMQAAGVALLLETEVRKVTHAAGSFRVLLGKNDEVFEVRAYRVFNCTYAGLNFLDDETSTDRIRLKYEIAEIALVRVPDPMVGLGVTVMDGPFFSCMPFPATGHHSLTHVRYTPHFAWLDTPEERTHPYDVLAAKVSKSNARYMIADAARYMPLMSEVQYDHSLYEIKTVLLSNEIDDGRPILFQHHDEMPGLFSILGGKIDNIFDVEEAMQTMMGVIGNSRQDEQTGLDEGIRYE